jgi:hypothetical protein
MVSSGMLRRVALVRTHVSERLSSSDTSVLTRVTQRNIPEDTILHSHRRENLKSYMDLFGSSGEGRKTPTPLGPLEEANLKHWISF